MEKIVAEFMNAGGAKSVDFFEKFKGDSQIQDFATRIGSEPSARKRDEEINSMLTYVKNNKGEYEIPINLLMSISAKAPAI